MGSKKFTCDKSLTAFSFLSERPRNPYLLIDGRRLDPGNLFIPVKENTELSVSCVVEGGNPPPSIKWDLILSPSLDPMLFGEEPPAKTHLNVSQTATSDGAHNRVFAHSHTRSDARVENILRSHHNGTVLCLAHHATLPSALNASLLLDVQCKSLMIPSVEQLGQ